MMVINKLFKYPMKRRKKSLLSVFCLLALVYAGFQIIYFEDEYSPLQLLSSVENEANRLLHFITQAHIQCNSSVAVATSNVTQWTICQDTSLGLSSDISTAKGIVYSVGPGSDLSFEQVIDKNSSYKLFIFSPLKSRQWDNFSNHTNFYWTSVVPNDPSDFARNSFQTQTLNSLHSTLKHEKINIAKIDNQMEPVQSHELLHFLIEDSWMANVKELHFVLQLDKVEEEDIYNWYRVVYSLFHNSGFRLYHTAASNSLCLQDTIMESCKYYLSWLQDVPPPVFVLYPPAIDGSVEYEEDRMMELLNEISTRDTKLFKITTKLYPTPGRPVFTSNGTLPQAKDQLMHIKLAEKVLENTRSCTILFILNVHIEHVHGLKRTKCNIISLIPMYANGVDVYKFRSISLSKPKTKHVKSVLTMEEIHSMLKMTRDNIMILEVGESWDSWGLLMSILSKGIPAELKELVLHTSIFQNNGKPHPMVLRRKYSAIKQIEAYKLMGVEWGKEMKGKSLQFGTNQDWVTINFVKNEYIR